MQTLNVVQRKQTFVVVLQWNVKRETPNPLSFQSPINQEAVNDNHLSYSLRLYWECFRTTLELPALGAIAEEKGRHVNMINEKKSSHSQLSQIRQLGLKLHTVMLFIPLWYQFCTWRFPQIFSNNTPGKNVRQVCFFSTWTPALLYFPFFSWWHWYLHSNVAIFVSRMSSALNSNWFSCSLWY